MAIVLEVGCSDRLSLDSVLRIVINSLEKFNNNTINISGIDLKKGGLVKKRAVDRVDDEVLKSIIFDYDTGVQVSFSASFFCLWPPKKISGREGLWTLIAERPIEWEDEILDQIFICPSVRYVSMANDEALVFGEFDFLENPHLPTGHWLYIDGRMRC